MNKRQFKKMKMVQAFKFMHAKPMTNKQHKRLEANVRRRCAQIKLPLSKTPVVDDDWDFWKDVHNL